MEERVHIPEESQEQTHGKPLYELTEREQVILRSVVKSFIETADPVGSRFLARKFPIGLSPASIRNTLSDLEEMGYLDHPYTSAGRVPTELGYRAYVEFLMERPSLPPHERQWLKQQLSHRMEDPELILKESSRLMGELARLLAIVLTPELSTGVLERLEVIPLSSSQLLFVLTVRGGLIRTLITELHSEIKQRELEEVVSILNERLAGLTLQEIKRTYAERVKDFATGKRQLAHFILSRLPEVVQSSPLARRICFGGAQHIVTQPEFQEPEEIRHVMELLEQEEIIIHLLESPDTSMPVGKAKVRIGRDHPHTKAEKYSIVTAQYRVGDSVGTIGILGPQRMDYSRAIALVETMARLLSRPAREKN